jgi:anthranilate synthase component 2
VVERRVPRTHETEWEVLALDLYTSSPPAVFGPVPFAYTLVQYVGEVVLAMGGDTENVVVRRNDAIDLAGIRRLDPDGIVISPGPGTPQEAGVSMPIFAELSIPTLGVCLGHQALCAANGAEVGHADAVVHGKSTPITHDGLGVFEGLPQGLEAGRYHSLAVRRKHLPDVLEETAQTDDEAGVVMGVRHREQPHVGVQFHPESILTTGGLALVANFVRECV